jgi:hypothetical protein
MKTLATAFLGALVGGIIGGLAVWWTLERNGFDDPLVAPLPIPTKEYSIQVHDAGILRIERTTGEVIMLGLGPDKQPAYKTLFAPNP